MIDNIKQESMNDFMAIEQAIRKSTLFKTKKSIKTRNLWILRSIKDKIDKNEDVFPFLVLWCGTYEEHDRPVDPDLLTFAGFEIGNDANAHIFYMSTCFRIDNVEKTAYSIWRSQFGTTEEEDNFLFDYKSLDTHKEDVLVVNPNNKLRFPVEQHHLVPKHLAKQLFKKHTCEGSEQWDMYRLEEVFRSRLLGYFGVDEEGTEVDLLISDSSGADEYLFLMVKESLTPDEYTVINKVSLYMFRHDVDHEGNVYSRFLTYLEDGNLDLAEFLFLCNGKIIIDTVTKYNNVSRDVREFMVTTQFKHLLDPMEEVKNYEKLKIKTN